MRQNMPANNGQSLIEALFVVVFTTIIMFAFIQVCIITVDDMIANEAAFVAMRSAAVTRNKYHSKEVHRRVKNYLTFFYPAVVFGTSSFNLSHFVLSDKKTVEKYFKKSDNYEENDSEEIFTGGDSSDTENKSATIWKGKKTARDYSGKSITKETVKIYYFTRVLFGSLVSKSNSFKNRRYQSARNRMVPSPDEEYYYKAFPGAKEFEKN
ncbi:MAG: hypothetical protein LBN01_03545 [Endomicrobium sp.]|jgi:hypothetical protein|nr:hypothetical protein [Endomicrobium sp.]